MPEPLRVATRGRRALSVSFMGVRQAEICLGSGWFGAQGWISL